MELNWHNQGVLSSRFLFRAYHCALQLGARKPVLLGALGTSEDDLRNPLKRYDVAAIDSLVSATAAELKNGDAAELIGQKMAPTGFSDVGYTAMFADTVGDAIDRLMIRFDLALTGQGVKFERHLKCDCLTVGLPTSQSRFLMPIIYAMVTQVVRSMMGEEEWWLRSAHFSHTARDSSDQFGRVLFPQAHIPTFFQCDSDHLEFAPHLFSAVNPRRNAAIIAISARQFAVHSGGAAEKTDLRSLTYIYLRPLLDKSGLSLNCAAQTFGMAERTLRRKLVVEGSSFRQILEQVRKDTCHLYFLEGDRILSDIASKLGYSELSAFTRAYTAWFGHPPSRDLTDHGELAA